MKVTLARGATLFIATPCIGEFLTSLCVRVCAKICISVKFQIFSGEVIRVGDLEIIVFAMVHIAKYTSLPV